MPRKTTRKGGSHAAKKTVPSEDAKPEQEKPSRKGKDNLQSEKIKDRSRRSSTAAQTAASVAESRGTRTRTGREESSDGQKTSGRDSVRTSRRAASRVNYKESDGEEETTTTTPKNEDNFASEEEVKDSESDEQSKPKKAVRSTPKRASTISQRGKGKGASRGRGKPGRKKTRTEESKAEEGDAEILSEEDDDDDKSTKKEVNETGGKSPKGSRASAKSQPADNAGRKSSRSRGVKSDTPVSRRPSRGTKVKKYTEVEEDFDDEAKSDGEGEEGEEGEQQSPPKEDEEIKPESEPEVKESRKRKRESEYEPNKKSKKDENEVAEKQVQPVVSEELKSDKKEESFEEPMEVDESVSEVDAGEKKDEEIKPAAEKGEESVKETVDSKETDSSEMPQSSKEVNSNEEAVSSPKESNHLEKTVDIVPSKTDTEPERVENSTTESKSNTPGVIKSVEKEAMLVTTNAEAVAVEGKEVANCTQSKPIQLPVQESTFLPKDQDVNSSRNGQSDKSVIREKAVLPEKPTYNFHYQNSSGVPPKENGAHGDLKRTYLEEKVPGRCYVENPRYSNLIEGQRANSVFRFGCVSCNLFLSALQQDKLVHELDKQAGIICIQNVSKSLFYDVLERNFDALGFKAATCWTNNSEFGLVTLYKTSLFRLDKSTEMPVRTLVEKRLENSHLNDVEKSATSQMLGKCGNVLLTEFSSIPEEKSTPIRIVNVKIPSTISSLHALQFMCLNQELAAQSDQFARHLICGEFNIMELELPYQMLRHGKLSDHLIDELKCQVDNAESAVAMKIISNSLHLPSLKLTSCYQSTMGKELTIPESKTTSPELLFISGGDIHTVGVLDLPSNYAEKVRQGQIPLKADIAITAPLSTKEPV